jgi:hypothetical protein
MVESYTDWLGNEIKVGDHIVYPGRQSSSLWMNHAKVLGFVESESYWGGKKTTMKVQHSDKSKRCWTKNAVVTLSALNRVTKV